MASVEGDDGVGAKAFGQRHDGRVDPAEREIATLLDEGTDPLPVLRNWTTSNSDNVASTRASGAAPNRAPMR